MQESLTELLLRHFQAHTHERAYGQRHGYRMEWFTYGEVLTMASHFAQQLSFRQIVKGDRILLWGTNSAQWVSVFLGCAWQGVVVVPMDDAASPDFAIRIARDVQTKLAVCSRKHAQNNFNGADSLILEDLSPLQPLDSSRAPTNIDCVPDDPLQIVFTSGTTTEPKGVVITHGNVLANIAPVAERIPPYLKYERLVHPIRFLNLLPLSHVFGQFLGIFLPPLLSGTVIFQEELSPSEIMRTIQHERVSVLVAVPRVLQSLKQKLERDLDAQGKSAQFQLRIQSSKDKHFLRRWWIFRALHRQFGWKFWAFVSGGATLDPATEEFWGRLGYAVIQGYGLTETTSLISLNHPFRLGKGSIGKVLPGRELKLAEDGEIMVRGGGVASAYWQGTERKNVSDLQGWYRTGDLGALDEQGNLYFKGRKKEVIVTPAGMNIYPDDLEAALRAQPEVKDCLVVAIERNGNTAPCAVAILRPGTNLEAAVRRANQSLAGYQQILHWLEWPEEDFLRTSTQKPKKKIVQEFAQATLSQSVQPDSTSSNPLAQLIANIAGRPVPHLNADSKLESDLGLSSLDRVELLSALEDRYQVDLAETNFNSAQTVGDLQRILQGQSSDHAIYHFPAWTLAWPVRWIRIAVHSLLTRPAMALLAWPHIEGRENLKEWPGPLLVVSNHIADVDIGFVQAALPARLRHRLATATRGEALEALRTPDPDQNFSYKIYARTGWFLGVSLLNLFPLPQASGFRQSFAYAGRAVDRGYSILVFPEGRYTVNGNINPFRAGIGLLANNLSLPVLPIRIVGLFELKQAGKKFAPPGKIKVRIGTPLRFSPDTPPDQIAAELQKAVEKL